jgi:hypothetical protein
MQIIYYEVLGRIGDVKFVSPSRKLAEAESLISNEKCTVVKVVMDRQYLGLSWVPDLKYPRWYLHDGVRDGRNIVGVVKHYPKEGFEYEIVGPNGTNTLKFLSDSIVNAKIECENAVREQWT